MSLVVASFLVGGWFSWLLPIAAALLVWTFLFLALAKRGKGE